MLKKLLLISSFALLLNGCDTAPKTGPDGYTFGTKQYEKSEVTINIVTYQSRKELLVVAKTFGVTNSDLAAFSILRGPNFNRCTIHMIDPSVIYEPEFVGHEMLHCFYGQWHTDNESKS